MKLAIVTPSYRSARFIRETIESVLEQDRDFDLYYHIQDGGSDDGTIAILEEYSARVARGEFQRSGSRLNFTWDSRPDGGMYAAINLGFSKVHGDINAWINADDRYAPNTFKNAIKVFRQFSQVEWLKGITQYIDEQSRTIFSGRCYLYDRDWIRDGIYGNEAYFVEQDSIFWRRRLWDQAGPIDPKLRLAGDFELWTKFANYAELYSVPWIFSSFRKVDGQLSQNLSRYRNEMFSIVKNRKKRPIVRLFFRAALRLRWPVFQWAYAFLFRKKHRLVIPTPDGTLTLRFTNHYSRASMPSA